MTKKFFTLFFALVASVGTMFAWDYKHVQIGDLYYNLDATNQTAEVTYKSYTNYEYNKGWDITTANIPASVEFYDGVGYSVTSIGEWAFSDCSGLTSVTIPNSVTSIGERAFSGCYSLTSVTIGNSVTSIGEWAFSSCHGLTSVTIGNNVTSIGKFAFDVCSGLTSVTIGNSVTSIGRSAFWGCTGLTSVHISDIAAWCAISFASNDANPLYYAYNLYLNGELVTDLVIPKGVTSIAGYAFYYCTGLTSVTIPNSVTSIGEDAFYDVPNIVYSGYAPGSPWGARSINGYIDGYLVYSDNTKTNLLACSSASTGDITIPNSVTSIGERAFSGCFGLTSVHISDIAAWCAISFGDDDANPLSYAHNLYLNGELVTDLVIPNSVTSIGDYAFCRTGLTSVTIPNSVTSIGKGAFFWCDGLTSVTIPNSVTSIGSEAFSECYSLTSVTIPNSVTSIGKSAFESCSSLTSVTIEAETPPTLGEDAFWDTNNCPIYVPCNAVNAYKTAWSEYADRIVANCSSFTISFVNWDGSNLQTTSVTEGEMPQYTGSTPTRPDDEEYTYTFSGWTPAIVAATEDATYTAQYTAIPIEEKEITNCAEAAEAALSVSADEVLYNNGKEYTVAGYVTAISNAWNSTYNHTSFWMADTPNGGNVLKAFRAICNSMSDVPYVGDYVRVTGKLSKYGTIPEFVEGCTYVIVREGEREGAEETETTEVKATPTEEGSVILEWPAVDGAATYAITIFKNGELVCSLTFDAEGHLISIAFSAPARDGNGRNMPAAEQAAKGWRYEVKGLEAGAEYTYTVTAKKDDDSVLFTQSVDFTMPAPQGIYNTPFPSGEGRGEASKILRDGQIFILRGDKTYTLTGQEVE